MIQNRSICSRLSKIPIIPANYVTPGIILYMFHKYDKCNDFGE